MRNLHNNGRRGRFHGWSTSVTVLTTDGSRYPIHRDTLQTYLPYVDEWGISILSIPRDIDDQDLGEANIDIAWDLLVHHLYCIDRTQIGYSLDEQIQRMITEQGGMTTDEDFTGAPSIPLTIKALGRILDHLGCSSRMLSPFHTLLTWILHPAPCRDPYIFAALLSAICDIAEVEPTRLHPAISLVQCAPDAENTVLWALNDPFCQLFFPLSPYLTRTLGIRAGQVPAAWPTPSWHGRGHGRSRSMHRLLPPPQPLPQSPVLMGPPVVRRPQMPARSKSSPGIRGNYLPPNVLMRVALAYPERVKVDGRLLFNNMRPMAFPGLIPARPMIG